MITLDAIVAGTVWPALRDLGFCRRRRVFLLETEVGDFGLIEFQRSTSSRPGRVAFFINYGVSLAPWLDWRSWQDNVDEVSVSLTDALWRRRLAPPARWADVSARWVVTDETATEAWGDAILDGISTEVMPRLRKLLDRATFARLLQESRRISVGLSFRPREVELLLAVGEHRQDDALRLLAELEKEPSSEFRQEFLRWARNRLELTP